MHDEAILACLKSIEAQLASDKYESGGFWTVGGPTGTYVIKSPFNTEAEWTLFCGFGNASVAISGSNPAVSVPNLLGATTYGAVTSGDENNAIEGVVMSLSANVGQPFPNLWKPLGRGGNVYVAMTVAANLSAYITIAFRRKLDRAIPAPPRQKAHTHTQPTSRRGARTFMAGFEAQYPRDKYDHELIPETQDTASIGNVENAPTQAEIVLAKLRGRSGMY